MSAVPTGRSAPSPNRQLIELERRELFAPSFDQTVASLQRLSGFGPSARCNL